MASQREARIVTAVQTYGRRLMGFIRQRVRGDEAEDLMQDVWLQLARVGDLDQIEELGAWLYQVARSKIIDRSRKKRALTMSELDIIHEDEYTLEELLFVETKTPQDETLRRLLWEEFEIAVSELPSEQRSAFVQNEIEGLTFDEMSKKTGVNLKTLISRKRYAVQKLRARMEHVRRDFLGE
ncbi:MAG: RNA polymerase sigma factor [Calditrichaeota bacterium]|nr:RNA polymerase sigma factor [Calditrichota bacterium]MCB9369231.1 RNA polymerase sigma factor [Calditrichota bacterium]